MYHKVNGFQFYGEFGFALMLTLVEFVLFTAVYHLHTQDDASTPARRTLISLASGCTAGKMCLAFVTIEPFKTIDR